MTILSFDSSTISSELDQIMSSNGSVSPHTVGQFWSIPRINLRKRPCATKMTNLESVNSAFLSGLFADVAKAAEVTLDDPSAQHAKKSRTSKTKSIARCDRSFAFVMKALNDSSEDDPPSESFGANSNPATGIFEATINRDNSLQYQLDCVTASSSSSSATSKSIDISSAANVAFPNLPATVSNSSCGNNLNHCDHHAASSPVSTLTHNISDLQSSDHEKTSQTLGNDTYGWFVEMDDDTVAPPVTPSISAIVSVPLMDPYFAPKDLAFSAQVAPKADNYDAELEWATAADTVDDVLGCFF